MIELSDKATAVRARLTEGVKPVQIATEMGTSIGYVTSQANRMRVRPHPVDTALDQFLANFREQLRPIFMSAYEAGREASREHIFAALATAGLNIEPAHGQKSDGPKLGAAEPVADHEELK